MERAGQLSATVPNLTLHIDGGCQMINQIARDRFAQANGWRYAQRGFTLDALIRGTAHGGKSDRRLFDYLHSNPFDHRESFRLPKSDGGRPVAILAHNYGADGEDGQLLRRLINDLEGKLVLHVPPTGEAASWYYPGATLPMCVTRPGIEVIWPTFDEMAEFAETYKRAREARHPEAGTWIPEPNPWD
jgi:hypothetical protein